MMDTVLNLGLNDRQRRGPRRAHRQPALRLRLLPPLHPDVRRRGRSSVDQEHFEDALSSHEGSAGASSRTSTSAAEDLQRAGRGRSRASCREHRGEDFPQEPREQLDAPSRPCSARGTTPRAATTARLNGIPDDLGTAVNVQAMVFGNMGDDSGTGVAFTRNPRPARRELVRRVPHQRPGRGRGRRHPHAAARSPTERDELPEASRRAVVDDRRPARERTTATCRTSSSPSRRQALHAPDPQRQAHRAGRGADRRRHGRRGARSTEDEALLRVEPGRSSPAAAAAARPATPRAEPLAPRPRRVARRRVGAVVFTADEAERLRQGGRAGRSWCAPRPRPDDIHGMTPRQGILTARGGMTSHAAVVARGMGKPCVVRRHGHPRRLAATARSRSASSACREGDLITIDGTTGKVFAGESRCSRPTRATRTLGHDPRLGRPRPHARRCAPTPTRPTTRPAPGSSAPRASACAAPSTCSSRPRTACRCVQRMILADDADGPARSALHKLLPFQQSDFEGIFRAMDGLPVTIRLLDPPLHEFLPDVRRALRAVADGPRTGKDDPEASSSSRAVQQLHEANPMLGTAAAASASSSPESTRCRSRAIIERRLRREGRERRCAARDHDPAGRLRGASCGSCATQVVEVAERCSASAATAVDYRSGTMIELPRAALRAGRDRHPGRLLLVRHQRPDPDHPRLQPRRRREASSSPTTSPTTCSPPTRSRRSIRRAWAGWWRWPWPRGAPSQARHQAGDLRRARRRPGLGRCSSTGRARLRVVLAVPGPDRPDRGGARGARRLLSRPVSLDDGPYELASLGDLLELIVEGWRVTKMHYADRSGPSGPPAAYFALVRAPGETRGVFVPDDGRALSHHAVVTSSARARPSGSTVPSRPSPRPAPRRRT